MSGIDEDKLIEQLVWSNTTYSLSQFVENFELPQAVRVDEGYYGESDKTSLDSDQILVMHFLRTKQKLIGEDSARTAIAIPLDCRVKCQVYPLQTQCRYEKILTDQMPFVYPQTKYFRVSEEHVNKEKCQKLLKVGTVLEIKTINSKMRSVICENVATKESVSLPFGCSTIFEPLLDYKEYTVKKVRKMFGLPAKVRFLEDKSETWNNPYIAKSMKLVSSLGKVTIVHALVTDVEVVATTVGGNLNSCLQLPKDLRLQVCLAEGLIRGEESYTNIVEALDQEFYNTALNDFDYGETDAYQHLDEIDVGITPGSLFERAESSGSELAATGPELPPRNIHVPPPVCPPKRSSSLNKKLKKILSRSILPNFKPRREQQPGKQSIGQSNASSRFPRNPTSPQKESKEREEYLAPLEDSDQHDYTYIDQQDIEDHIDAAEKNTQFPRSPTSPHKGSKGREEYLAPVEDSDQHDYTYIDQQDIEDHIDAAEKSIQDVFMDFSVEIASGEIKRRMLHSSGEHGCSSLKSEAGSYQATAFSVISPKSTPKQIAESKVLKRSPKMSGKFKTSTKKPVGLKSLSSFLHRDKSDSGSSGHVETTQPELDYIDVIEKSNYTDLDIYYVPSNEEVYQKLDLGKEELTKRSIAELEVFRGSAISTRKSTVREGDYDEPDSGTAQSLTKPSISRSEVSQRSTMFTGNSTVREGDYDEPDSGTAESLTKLSTSRSKVSQRSTMSTRKLTVRADDYDEPDSGTARSLTKHIIAEPEVPQSTSSEKEAIYQNTIARIPQDLSSLSIKDVGSLLVNLSMAAYVQLFEDELVDGDMLVSMDQEALESLNVSSYHVKKLLKFINGWRPNVTSVLK